jgi:hypothetical protein
MAFKNSHADLVWEFLFCIYYKSILNVKIVIKKVIKKFLENTKKTLDKKYYLLYYKQALVKRS